MWWKLSILLLLFGVGLLRAMFGEQIRGQGLIGWLVAAVRRQLVSRRELRRDSGARAGETKLAGTLDVDRDGRLFLLEGGNTYEIVRDGSSIELLTFFENPPPRGAALVVIGTVEERERRIRPRHIAPA